MIASSQVEITTSTPFGHRRRDSCFQNNINNLVTSCNIPNDNSHHIDLADLWVHQPQWQATTNTKYNNDYDHNRSNDYNPLKTEEAHNHKDKWARARDIVFHIDRRSRGFTSPQQSESSVGVSISGGVSSLVQKWRGFEAEAKSSGKNWEPTDDDSIGDWESDRTACSGPSSCRGRDSDFTESERLRVADIIRKLTDDVGYESPPRVRTSSWDHQSTEQRCLSPVVGSTRIRGRQAYIDLLKQMERDRRKELEGLIGRKAVSGFSYRGRIQALLRIRFLRRGMEAKDGQLSSESYKAKKSLSSHFRERANQNFQNGCGNCQTDATPNLDTVGKDKLVANSKGCIRVWEEQDVQQTSIVQQKTIETKQDIQENANMLHNHEHVQHVATPFAVGQETNISYHSSTETIRTFDNTEISSTQTLKEDNEANNHQILKINYDLTDNCTGLQNNHEEESSSKQHVVESDTYWVSDISHPEVGWEELHSDYEHGEVSMNDWIGEVSRPRSDWEDLRQARYQEMLDPFLDNEEIRALLGRKSVSTFLSSAMREKIDQLMVCRSQGYRNLNNIQTQKENHQQLPEQGQAITLGEDEENEQNDEREGYGDYFNELEGVEGSAVQQYNEYMSNMTSTSPALWPQNQGLESSVDSAQQSPFNYYSHDNRLGSSSYTAHPAIEMELIYDLRRHMEQLHQEMSELRKSIKCCTDMQIKLQHSIKKEVTSALSHADTENGRRNPMKKDTTGGRCCVCCKVQVDCVLYRCGHMCTCFQCAHEMQWNSGKCPICRASIMDVVRICSNC